MADAVWPAGLSTIAPQLVSWTKTEPKLTERSAMDAGPAKVRRRFTAGVTTHTVELVLTRTQMGLFREFWHDTVQGGALAFEWKDWETQDVCEYRFLSEPTERPLRPRGSGSDDHWSVSFQLEQLPAGAGAIVTPPSPDNEPPDQLILELDPQLQGESEFIVFNDTGYVPPASDPDQIEFPQSLALEGDRVQEGVFYDIFDDPGSVGSSTGTPSTITLNQ